MLKSKLCNFLILLQWRFDIKYSVIWQWFPVLQCSTLPAVSGEVCSISVHSAVCAGVQLWRYSLVIKSKFKRQSYKKGVCRRSGVFTENNWQRHVSAKRVRNHSLKSYYQNCIKCQVYHQTLSVGRKKIHGVGSVKVLIWIKWINPLNMCQWATCVTILWWAFIIA